MFAVVEMGQGSTSRQGSAAERLDEEIPAGDVLPNCVEGKEPELHLRFAFERQQIDFAEAMGR